MTYQFRKHYTVEEARALLPEIREWLTRLVELRDEVDLCEKRIDGMCAPGADLGGETVNRRVRALAAMKITLLEFYRREIQVKDLDRGLVDFPAIIGGKEVFLCWERGENDIEHWHELDSGYAGRQSL